ncbi:rhamnulokinase [candidate division KSB1 bacterium]|nr:rhamnulokinase [candidate division KSB1 bacterium]
MAGSNYLAVDFGAESGRVILGKLDKILSLEQIHRFDNRQIQVMGHYHWDVLNLFSEIKIALNMLSNRGITRFKGIGMDTWGCDFGLIGRDNVLLGNPVCYRDSRTDGMMEAAFELMPRDEIYKYSGIQFMQLNTIFQLFSMVKSNHPVLDIAEKLLFMPDLFHFLLSGEKKTEYTIASTSQLINAQDKSWEAKIFAKLGLPLDIMAPLVEPGTVLGTLLPEICRQVNIEPADVIASATHDTAAAVAAVPAQDSDWIYLSSGTWSLMGIESDDPVIGQASLQNNFTNEGGIKGTIRFLKNIMGLWLLQGCRKSWQKQGNELDYGEIVGLAEQATPFKSLVDPDDSRFLNPPDMPKAIEAFCRRTDQTPPETPGEFARCVLESLALKYRYVSEKLEQMAGKSFKTIHIVGGGTKNKLLNQFTADATGIKTVTGPIEATAIGNILVQALAKEEISSLSEARRLVVNSFPLETYQPKQTEQWDKIYERFKSYIG